MCGLVGYSGRTKADLARIKLLAIFNRERGKDSVGFLINNKVGKATWYNNTDVGDPLKYFQNVYWPNYVNDKIASRVIMFHNRQATVGYKTVENAHPFEYEIDGVKHYFAHNGTLTNYLDLAKNHGLNFSDYKVDSRLLGYIIATQGFGVLTEYVGYAAFLYYRDDEPNTLYAWKGASKEYTDAEEVERPLYYVKYNSGIYLSSLASGLECGLDVRMARIEEVPDNTLLVIKDGEIVEQLYYDRSNIPKREKYSTGRQANDNAYSNWGNSNSGVVVSSHTKRNNDPIKRAHTKNQAEPSPQYKAGNRIYFWKGMYYQNGHPVSGVWKINGAGCTLIPMNEAPEIGDAENIYYFHMGLWCASKNDFLTVQGTIKKLGDVIPMLEFISASLHPKSIHFHFEESMLRVLEGGKRPTGHVLNITPKFAYYSYTFWLSSGNYDTVEPTNVQLEVIYGASGGTAVGPFIESPNKRANVRMAVEGEEGKTSINQDEWDETLEYLRGENSFG